MKFAQFVELEEKLAGNGHTVEDLKEELKKKEDLNMLFEFFGMNKALASWGVKSAFNKKLQNHIDKFTDETEKAINDAIVKFVRAKAKINMKKKELADLGKPMPPEMEKQIANIENSIMKIVNNFIEKQSELKTSQIEERIDSSKKMKESAKLGLKYLWQKLLVDSKVTLFTKLIKAKIIQTPAYVEALGKTIKEEEKKSKEEAAAKNKEIKSLMGEEKEPVESAEETI